MQLCSEVYQLSSETILGFLSSSNRSSEQRHAGRLQVPLEVLERFCIEAGAHH